MSQFFTIPGGVQSDPPIPTSPGRLPLPAGRLVKLATGCVLNAVADLDDLADADAVTCIEMIVESLAGVANVLSERDGRAKDAREAADLFDTIKFPGGGHDVAG